MEQRFNKETISFAEEAVTSESEYDSDRAASWSVYEVNVALAGVHEHERAKMCDICGESARESEVREFRGVNYGVPCGCSKDIGSVLLQEEVKKGQVRRVRNERLSEPIEGWEDNSIAMSTAASRGD